MHDRHVLIMHGAEHLLGELHIPLVFKISSVS